MKLQDEKPIMPEELIPAREHTFMGKAGRVISAVSIVGVTMLGAMPVHAEELENGSEGFYATQAVSIEPAVEIPVCIQMIWPICVVKIPICISKTSE